MSDVSVVARITNKAAKEGVNLPYHALALMGVILQGEVVEFLVIGRALSAD